MLETKLSSQRWQQELKRGEDLAHRLEQAASRANHATGRLCAALHDFEQCQQAADQWHQQHAQAQRTLRQLKALLEEATRVGMAFDQSLTQRRKMLEGVARNTAKLMELVEAARHEALPPAETSRGSKSSRTQQAEPQSPARMRTPDWPTFRVRPAGTATVINKVSGA